MKNDMQCKFSLNKNVNKNARHLSLLEILAISREIWYSIWMIGCQHNRISCMSPCLELCGWGLALHIQLYLLFTLSLDFRIGRHFFSKTEVCITNFVVLIFLRKVNYFLYMLMKIIDGRMEGRKVVQKSKGRQELHSGLLLRLWPLEKICLDSFQSCGFFWSLCCKNMPPAAAEVDVRGTGWRSKKLRCPCLMTNDRTSKAPIYSTVHLLHI